jgi:hypothetical protein
MNTTLAICMIVKNEEQMIGDCLHLQRNASDVWWGWVNFTGGKNTWFECGSMTKSVSIEKIVVSCGMGTTSGQSAFTGSPGGIDWIRKDWITL